MIQKEVLSIPYSFENCTEMRGNMHMRAHLLPLFSSPPFLTALLTLVSDLHTKSICNYFSIFPHSSSPAVCNCSLCFAFQNETPLHITAKRSLAPSVSLRSPIPKDLNSACKTAHFNASASGTNSAIHAYQICQITNGRAG